MDIAARSISVFKRWSKALVVRRAKRLLAMVFQAF